MRLKEDFILFILVLMFLQFKIILLACSVLLRVECCLDAVNLGVQGPGTRECGSSCQLDRLSVVCSEGGMVLARKHYRCDRYGVFN